MKNSVHFINTWAQQVFVLGKMNLLQQAILQTPSETITPSEALSLVYEELTNEQKIAFILAGGAASLSQYQQQTTRSTRTGKDSLDTDTGPLPIAF
jgi:hypothetical protein